MSHDYIPIYERPKFDESMEAELFDHGFKHYDDWKYGPQVSWSLDNEHMSMILMRHDYGYWIIIGQHASGTNPRMNIGSSNSAKEIIAIRDAMKKLW